MFAISRRLQILRASQGWSQEDAAALVGMSRRTWIRVENGDRPLERLEADLLARAARIESSWILEGTGTEPTGTTQGRRVRQARTAADMDRADLAARMKLPAWKMDRIEGDTLPLDEACALRLAALLGHTPEWYLDGEAIHAPSDDSLVPFPGEGPALISLRSSWMHSAGINPGPLQVLTADGHGYPKGTIALWTPSRTPRGPVVVAGPTPHLALSIETAHPIGEIVLVVLPFPGVTP